MKTGKSKIRKFVFGLLLAAVTVNTSTVAIAQPTNYTYNYDFWFETVASPDAYFVAAHMIGSDFGVGNLSDPQGLFVRDNRVYICDSGKNRIVVLEYTGENNYELIKVVDSVIIDGEESSFRYPRDIFETEEGEIYIADTNNQRILHLDKDWNYIKSILQPADGSIDSGSDFLPSKLVVDNADRVFVQAVNVNKGLMEFDSNGDFTGFMGANRVRVNMIDYIWKTFLSTQEQRSQLELFVPTEYNNVAIDEDGFIYATTSTFAENQVASADPVRRLNATGTDILIRNGYEPPYGDLSWSSAGGISGPSRFVDVVAMENDSYCVLDRNRGRLFMYDFQGNMLYAFGGPGNRAGYFQNPTAIDRMGYSLLVLDSRMGSITRFDLTEYGSYINGAINEYKVGEYGRSAELWEEVLKLNGNYDLAYIGIARAALREGDYKKAMDYYKVKRHQEGYGKAFQLYRKQWMEENISKIVIVAAILIITPKVVRFAIKIRKEVMEE